MTIPKPAALLSLFTSLLACSGALAAEGSAGTRGGGNAHVCFSDKTIAQQVITSGGVLNAEYLDQITRIEMLDLVEAKLKRGNGHDEDLLVKIREGEMPEAFVQRVIQRLEQTVPSLADEIKIARSAFSGPGLIFHPTGLAKINDEDTVTTPGSENCLRVTLAIQEDSSQGRILRVDERLLRHPKHSAMSQAVLWLHEYLYYVGHAYGQTTAKNTREMVEAILSKDLTLDELLNKGTRLGFILYTIPAGTSIPGRDDKGRLAGFRTEFTATGLTPEMLDQKAMPADLREKLVKYHRQKELYPFQLLGKLPQAFAREAAKNSAEFQKDAHNFEKLCAKLTVQGHCSRHDLDTESGEAIRDQRAELQAFIDEESHRFRQSDGMKKRLSDASSALESISSIEKAYLQLRATRVKAAVRAETEAALSSLPYGPQSFHQALAEALANVLEKDEGRLNQDALSKLANSPALKTDFAFWGKDE